MNRIVTMVLKNLWHVPGAWFKLCHYAKHTDKYTKLADTISAAKQKEVMSI